MKVVWPVFALVLSCLVVVSSAVADLKESPTGKEIAAKAKKAKLLKDKAVKLDADGKKVEDKPKVTLTPADLTAVKEKDLENGHIIGRLDTELPGKHTKLPAGKYNLFAAKVKGKWHVYAEADDKIVAEATRVKFEKKKATGTTPSVERMNIPGGPHCWGLCWRLTESEGCGLLEWCY